MSFQDAICVFMDNDALTDAQAAHNADHFLDLETYGEADKQLGFVWWNILIGTVGTAGAGMYLKLVASDSATFATKEIIASIGDATDMFGFADWPAGRCWSIGIPVRQIKYKHLGVEFVETTDAVALTVDSWLGMEPICPQNIQKEPT